MNMTVTNDPGDDSISTKKIGKKRDADTCGVGMEICNPEISDSMSSEDEEAPISRKELIDLTSVHNLNFSADKGTESIQDFDVASNESELDGLENKHTPREPLEGSVERSIDDTTRREESPQISSQHTSLELGDSFDKSEDPEVILLPSTPTSAANNTDLENEGIQFSPKREWTDEDNVSVIVFEGPRLPVERRPSQLYLANHKVHEVNDRETNQNKTRDDDFGDSEVEDEMDDNKTNSSGKDVDDMGYEENIKDEGDDGIRTYKLDGDEDEKKKHKKKEYEKREYEMSCGKCVEKKSGDLVDDDWTDEDWIDEDEKMEYEKKEDEKEDEIDEDTMCDKMKDEDEKGNEIDEDQGDENEKSRDKTENDEMYEDEKSEDVSNERARMRKGLVKLHDDTCTADEATEFKGKEDNEMELLNSIEAGDDTKTRMEEDHSVDGCVGDTAELDMNEGIERTADGESADTNDDCIKVDAGMPPELEKHNVTRIELTRHTDTVDDSIAVVDIGKLELVEHHSKRVDNDGDITMETESESSEFIKVVDRPVFQRRDFDEEKNDIKNQHETVLRFANPQSEDKKSAETTNRDTFDPDRGQEFLQEIQAGERLGGGYPGSHKMQWHHTLPGYGALKAGFNGTKHLGLLPPRHQRQDWLNFRSDEDESIKKQQIRDKEQKREEEQGGEARGGREE